jgi:two-component system chemotaxis response regulator CheY
MRILVAEDDYASRLFMEKILSQYGTLDVATDGLEAIDAFEVALEAEDPYDVVFLDIMMPKLDGITVLKVIRNMEKQQKSAKHAKTIMTTALNDDASIKAARQNGCDAYLWKPILPEQIIALLSDEAE